MCGLINPALLTIRTCDRHAQAHIHHALLDAARPKRGCDGFMHHGDAAQRLTVPPRREQQVPQHLRHKEGGTCKICDSVWFQRQGKKAARSGCCQHRYTRLEDGAATGKAKPARGPQKTD